MSTAAQLITAEEYALLAPADVPTELVQGEIVEMNLPVPRHGQVCVNIAFYLRTYLKDHPSGHVFGNDSGLITQRDPDTVRGADVCYISYDKVPPGPLPTHYLDVAPDIVFEVLSPSDRRAAVLRKVSEYLEAGVAVVCVVNPQSRSVQLFYPDRDVQFLLDTDEVTFESLLPGFRVSLADLLD